MTNGGFNSRVRARRNPLPTESLLPRMAFQLTCAREAQPVGSSVAFPFSSSISIHSHKRDVTTDGKVHKKPIKFQLTRGREMLLQGAIGAEFLQMFQLTRVREMLLWTEIRNRAESYVSTHSRARDVTISAKVP